MKQEKLLIVENESIIAKDLELSLKRLGWIVIVTAYSGEDAIELARSAQPDLILLDIQLGKGIDGIEAAQEISSFSDVPVIYITAFTDEETLNRAKSTKPYGYIIKPIEDRNLQVAIEMALYKYRVEKELKEKDKWVQMIIENLDEGLIAVDRNGNIQMINPYAEFVAGIHKTDIIGLSQEKILVVIDEYTGTPLRIPFYKSMIEAELVPIRNGIQLKTPEGHLVSIEGKCVPIIDENSEVSGSMMIFHDVTRKKHLETRLRQAQKMEALGTLSGGIAHDFNNILSAIMGYTELAIKKIPVDSPVHQSIDHVLTASRRASELVKQILAFSRQSEERKQPVQVSTIIKEVLKLLRSSLPSTIEIEQNILSPQTLILSDPIQLHQVMINLCTNAAYAMRGKGGKLSVRLEEIDIVVFDDISPGAYICLTVSDTGYGMDNQVLSHIFDPYFTTKPPEEGIGMGLALVHGIVESHGGRIRVQSVPGKGTTFKIYFPRIIGPVNPDSVSPITIKGGNERILYLDDEPLLVDLGKELLEPLGYTITGRTNSTKAFEDFLADPFQFDLVITDFTMPRMTGVEFIRRIREIRPDMPVILCTGFSDGNSIQDFESLGIGEVVLKPIILEKIASAIREVLDNQPPG